MMQLQPVKTHNESQDAAELCPPPPPMLKLFVGQLRDEQTNTQPSNCGSFLFGCFLKKPKIRFLSAYKMCSLDRVDNDRKGRTELRVRVRLRQISILDFVGVFPFLCISSLKSGRCDHGF